MGVQWTRPEDHVVHAILKRSNVLHVYIDADVDRVRTIVKPRVIEVQKAIQALEAERIAGGYYDERCDEAIHARERAGSSPGNTPDPDGNTPR